MSLVAWYPLNGTLNNYGIGDAGFGNTEGFGEYSSLGIFGQGLQGSGKTLYWTAKQSASLLNSREMSFAFWVYINAPTGDTYKREMFFGEGGAPRTFSIFNYPTCNDIHLSWQNSSNGKWLTTGVINGVLPSYEWTHVCVVYKKPRVILYINGQPTEDRWGNEIDYTGEDFNKSIPVLYQHPNRILNDYRVYNHALSLNEVHDLAKGRVLHMLFNDPLLDTRNTTTKVLDYSGFQWNGQGSNLQVVDEGNGLYPINFDGVASRKIVISNFPSIAYNITYNVWIKRTSDSPNQTEFVLSHGRDYDIFGLNLGLTNKKPCARIGTSENKGFYVVLSKELPLNERHMLTVTYDRKTCNLYLDGGSKTTAQISGNIDYSQSDNALVIGKMSYGHISNDVYFPFHGEVLQADVYATALSDVDISRLYYARKIVDRNANITTRLVTETAPAEATQLTRQGVLKTNGLNEIFVDNDGRVWCPVLYHDNRKGTNLFSEHDDFDKFVYHNEDCWANFPLMKHYGGVGGVWRIREYQEHEDRPMALFYWTQTANPFTATFEDVAAANTSERSENLAGNFGGIYIMRGNTYMVQNNGTKENWYGALGCYSPWFGGIPGVNGQKCVGITALYVEVDPSILTAKQYRGGIDYAREFQED